MELASVFCCSVYNTDRTASNHMKMQWNFFAITVLYVIYWQIIPLVVVAAQLPVYHLVAVVMAHVQPHNPAALVSLHHCLYTCQ